MDLKKGRGGVEGERGMGKARTKSVLNIVIYPFPPRALSYAQPPERERN